MTDSQRLLADYIDNGSEAAFRELAGRYIDLVYSTAVRLVGGDTHLAEDVAQTVFIDLARTAKRLSPEVKLGGWLHRHTCFVAANTLRGERRRQAREKQAVEMNELPDHSEAHLNQIAPLLDEAINQLGATDRAAVLLRFYERLDFRSVGAALGTNEAAAQKRVSRALEKLHTLLKRRGVSFSAGALGIALTGEAVTAAPAGLAANISGAALASATAGIGSTLTFLEFMATAKLKTGIVTSVVVVASVVAPLLVQHHAQAGLRDQDAVLRGQSDRLAQVAADNKRLSDLIARANIPGPSSENQLHEVLRLRSEVGRLKEIVHEDLSARAATPLSPEDQLAAMKKLYAERVGRLKQWLEENPSEKIPELKTTSDAIWLDAAETLTTDDDFARTAANLRDNAELQVFDILWGALQKYGKDNNGQFPTTLSQLAPYFRQPIDDAVLQRYEIVPTSSLAGELQPGGDWAITQVAPVNPSLDMRMAYGLTDMRNADERVSNRWSTFH